MGHLFFGICHSICHIKIIKKKISFRIAKFCFKLCSSRKTIEKIFYLCYIIHFINLYDKNSLNSELTEIALLMRRYCKKVSHSRDTPI